MKEITILIVEDELIISLYLQQILNNAGYKTLTARTSIDAIEKINIKVPEMILMDVNLKGSNIDGIETADIINKNHKIPIVFHTSSNDTCSMERMQLTEPAGIFIKPAVEKDLLLFIKNFISMPKED